MKLGFGLINCQRVPDDPRTDTELYRDAVDVAVLAERARLRLGVAVGAPLRRRRLHAVA